MSRRSHDLPGRSGNPVAGQRAAGGTFQNGFELVGHVMYKSCLILRAMECFSGKPSAINVARSVWEGADEKGPAMVPRQPPTSFLGEGAMGTLPPLPDEIWLSILVRKLLKRGSFTSIEDLRAKVLAFIDYYNQTMAKPFKWTYQGKALMA